MLNLEENLELTNEYNTQRDLIIKSVCYSISIVIVLDLIRGQLPEVNLLQLIPGFYLFILFTFFFFALILSNFLIRISVNLETKKNYGTKTLGRINYSITFIFSLILFFFIGILNFQTVIPISLDSFNSYGEKTLENLWSLNEVIGLEITLFFLLSFISQIPIIINYYLKTEKDIVFLPNFWRLISLSIISISGFLTPTIDGYTQLSFAFSAFSLYLILILFLEKRSLIKFFGISLLGF
jgi:hypothetical protein